MKPVQPVRPVKPVSARRLRVLLGRRQEALVGDASKRFWSDNTRRSSSSPSTAIPPANTGGFNPGPTGDPRSLLAREPEPPALVLNELDCYHFRVLDPRLPLRSQLTSFIDALLRSASLSSSQSDGIVPLWLLRCGSSTSRCASHAASS